MLSALETAPDAPRPAVDHARRVEELGRIILAYSEVTEKLQQSHDQLTRTVQSLQQELGEKNKQLERKNRLAALGEMAAGLAHEIRNPLGGIQLYASLLRDDLADRPASLTVVQKIAAGVHRLEALVGKVLQFSRESHIDPVAVDLRSLVEQAVELASPALGERQVRCVVEGPGGLEVHVDEVAFGQVLLNLVQNAAEACEAGGTVTVAYASEPGRQFRLSVADTGAGIPPTVLDKLFNPFFTTKDNGTGLGLSIVHRIIEAHDGTITASNTEPGGARFEIVV